MQGTYKLAVVTGITGQDGSYLSELLLDKGYMVVGVKRRSSTNTTGRLTPEVLDNENFELIEGDVTDPSSINHIVNEYKPDEWYNLCGQTHVATSFKQPLYTFQVNSVGVLNVLESIRLLSPKTKLLQASSSEMFGSNYQEKLYYKDPETGPNWPPVLYKKEKYQDEKTPLAPNSPYAVSKVAAHHLVDNYRKAYGLHASCSICYNHGSPRRGEEFVTRKITKWIGQFYRWKQDYNVQSFISDNIISTPEYRNTSGRGSKFPRLRLGNLDAFRDWGHAKDYVSAYWMMLQQDSPSDFVIATGETHSVKDFVKEAFQCIDIDNWEDYIVIDPKFYRPVEVDYLLGDASKAKEKLGWEPTIGFKELVKEMVEADITRSIHEA